MKKNLCRPANEILWSQRILPRKILSPSGCWEWPGALAPGGYGKLCFRVSGKGGKVLVHRVSVEIKAGRQLTAGECSLHHCDNRKCFNPDHLFIGTREDNARDRANKGRNADMSGAKNARCNTTKLLAEQILSEYGSGWVSQRELSKRHNLSKGAIWNILNGKHWTARAN